MSCHRCGRPVTGEHPCIERGTVLPDGTHVAADQNYCSVGCLAADLEPTTQETAAP